MLFSKYAIEKCMQIYDTSLVGFGIDWLFIWNLGKDEKKRYEIIDNITCINPKTKNTKREIEKLQSNEHRFLNWLIVCKKLGIETWTHSNHSGIRYLNS